MLWSWTPRHSLRRRAVTTLKQAALKDAPRLRPVRTPVVQLATLRAALLAVLMVNGIAAILSIAVDPPITVDADGFLTLWQVQATIIGLALALTVFVLESGGLTARLRRDLTTTTRVYQAATIGVLLVVVTGEAVALGHFEFGQWLQFLIWPASLFWAGLVFVAIREVVQITDPVHRVARRRTLLLQQTDTSLGAELVRNVAQSILTKAVEGVGGNASPFGVPHAELPETARVRSRGKGQVTDVNLRAVIRSARAEQIGSAALTLSIRLDEIVGPDTLLAESTRVVPDANRRRIQRAIHLRTPKATPDIGSGIEALRFEAQSSIGPDTTVLEAVCEAYEAILERYALGWRQYVPGLDAANIDGFRSSSGVPLAAIEMSLYQLADAAVQSGTADAVFQLAYFPVRILQRAVSWQAPAYFRLLALYPALYRFLGRADAALLGRVGERPWLHLVEALEFLLPISQPPYVAESRGDVVDTAGRAIRSSLVDVLRLAVRRGDADTIAEALRRWRIAEEDRATSRTVPDALQFVAPVAWEVVRQAFAGAIASPRRMLDSCSADATFANVLVGIEAQLDSSQRIVDLSEWAMFDMKSHEAGFIDSDTDLMKAFLLGAAISVDPSGSLAPLSIRRVLYEHRESFARAADDLKASSATTEPLFGIVDLPGRLDRILVAWDEGIRLYERAERDALRASPLDPAQAEEFRRAVVTGWSTGFPQSWFETAGVITPRGRGVRGLTTSAWADKTFFIARNDLADAAVQIGSGMVRPLLDGELRLLRDTAAKVRGRTYGARRNVDRIRAAIADLGPSARGGNVLFLPRDWGLLSALASEQAFHFASGSRDGTVGLLDGLRVYDLGDHEADWGVLISPDRGLVVIQPPNPIDAQVREVDPTWAAKLALDGLDAPGDPLESKEERLQLRVSLTATVSLHLRVQKAGVRRIKLIVR